MRRLPTARLVAVAALALIALPAAASAAAPSAAPDLQGFVEEGIRGYDVTLRIEKSGVLLVHETIDYDFGTIPKHGILRNIPDRVDYAKKHATDRVYPIDIVSVRGSEGTPDEYETSDYTSNGIGYEQIKIGDP